MEEKLSEPGKLETLGARLAWARVYRTSFNQTDVAAFLGYPKHSRISQWETCRNFPSLDALVQVAGLYRVSIEWLIWGGDMAGGIDERVRRIPKILRDGLVQRIHQDIVDTEASIPKLPRELVGDVVKDSDERLKSWSAKNLRTKKPKVKKMDQNSQ